MKLVKKTKKKSINTPFGRIKNEKNQKEEYFIELCRMEDRKIEEALSSLHSRLSEYEKDIALKWSIVFNALIRNKDD